jgi:type III pantothenate kinase
MYLVLDFGNSYQKLALFSNGEMIRMEQASHTTVSKIKEFVSENHRISASILSSVIPYPVSIRKFLESNFSFLEMNETTPVPFMNMYTNPATLGYDRLAAAVAGFNAFPEKNVLVIVLGSAITYNLITKKREFLGGAISPGMNMRFRALHTFTGKLPLVTFSEVPDAVGRDTEGSLLSGVINGITTEIRGMTEMYRKKFPGLETVISGGDLNYFINRLKISIFAFPDIVLHGLHQILDFNVKKTL